MTRMLLFTAALGRRESLGWYQAFSETTASTDPEAVEQFCLAHIDDRWS